MKKIVKIGIISIILLSLTGCVDSIINAGNSIMHSVNNRMANIKPDTTAIVATTSKYDSDSVDGKGKLILKNIDTNEEVPFFIDYSDKSYYVKKVTPGRYKIEKWNYDSCFTKDVKSDSCTEWHDFGGVSPVLQGNTFTVNKGEIVYLGHISLDSANKTLSISDDSSSDIAKFKSSYDALKNRDIKNISSSLNVHNWGFRITGAGWFK